MKYSLRSLMRFSIRDLALVTVIVGLALGWWVREGQLAGELARTKRWRNAAGALEKSVRGYGFDIRWQFDSHEPGVELNRDGYGSLWQPIESSNEPSQDQLPQTPNRMPGLLYGDTPKGPKP